MAKEPLKSRGLTAVSVVNQKGGVGKTTAVISLGTGLAMAGQRVLLVDGDPQGNLTLFFTNSTVKDLYGLFKELAETGKVARVSDYIVRGVRENLDLVPQFHRKLRTDMSDNQISDILLNFIALVGEIKASYDWVLFDCSPSNGRLEKLIISSSDAVLVPLEFQLFSIAGLSSLLDEITSCAHNVRREIPVEALVFVKSENRLNRINEYREIFKTFYIPIYEVCKSEYLSRSIEARRSIWEHAPTSNVCRDYYRIIEKTFLGLKNE